MKEYFVCKNCEEQSELKPNMQSMNVCIDGFNVTLLSVNCKHCGFNHIVQIDDESTKNMLIDLQCMIMDSVKCISKSGRKSLNKHIEQLQTKLNTERANLIKFYSGRVYQFGDQKSKLDFIVPRVFIESGVSMVKEEN